MNEYNVFINENPISKVISDKLKAGLKEDCPVSFAKTDNEQCGTISWDGVSLEKLKEITAEFETIPKETFFDEKVKAAKELNRKMNEYLDGKIKEYLRKHLLTIFDWEENGKCSTYLDRRYEYYYKDEFICGAKINISPDATTLNMDCQIELILY